MNADKHGFGKNRNQFELLTSVVNENGKLLGMVSMGDIAVETEADRELGDALEDISKESSFWGKVFG